MASSSKEDHALTKRWADICLEDEEEHEVSLADDCDEEEELNFDDRWCLVGRMLSGKVSDFQIFQNIIADLWKPGRGIFIKILEQNRFLFQFYHEIDIKRVIDGSPWTYDRKQLLIERLKPGGNPKTIAINTLDMWSFLTASPWLRSGKGGHDPAKQSTSASPSVNVPTDFRGTNSDNCDPHDSQPRSRLNSVSRDYGNQQSTLKEHVVLVNDNSASFN
ncbi:hypothetical protein G4B88_008368 [Cannabis sativa]|uniref:DUF4283 domain-containing protein n=1 Tax=Cannabis sativa TaxID=3483 RepID=A0A7J6G7R2_CANSA|nr:hypothetical protein G4B88_008368 [Cannabis sativa]